MRSMVANKIVIAVFLALLSAVIGCEKKQITIKSGETKIFGTSFLQPVSVTQNRERIEHRWLERDGFEGWSEKDDKSLRISVDAPDFLQIKILRSEVRYTGENTVVGFNVKPTSVEISASPEATFGEFQVSVYYRHSNFEQLQLPDHPEIMDLLKALGYIYLDDEEIDKLLEPLRITCQIPVTVL